MPPAVKQYQSETESEIHYYETGPMSPCPLPRRETVSLFPRYQNTFGSLPAAEQQKVRNIAELVRRSFRPGCRPFRVIRLVGHADRDVTRGASFERQISLERARAVENALKKLIGRTPVSSRIRWLTSSAGAGSLVVPVPHNESERARNRRVEVLLAQGAPNRWETAVEENRHLSQSLAWQAYKSSIIHLLGFKSIPNEYAFAEAVARWQRKQRGLPVNGIIGSETLRRMQPALQAPQSSLITPPAREASFHHVASDPEEMRRLYFDVRHELPDGAERFWTEGKHLGIVNVSHGHGELAEKAAALVGLDREQRAALRRGVVRPDEDPPLSGQIDECQQHRHALRAVFCQGMPQAIDRIRTYLRNLYECILKAPVGQSPDTQFELAGEALHLIQDSYSPAHMERNYAGRGGVHTINYIRFWHFVTIAADPLEHKFPVDLRDNLTVASFPLNWVDEAITASQEFLNMLQKHIGRLGDPANMKDLMAFMDKHLRLSSHHTTFSQVVAALREMQGPAQTAAYVACLGRNAPLKSCENLLPGFCGRSR